MTGISDHLDKYVFTGVPNFSFFNLFHALGKKCLIASLVGIAGCCEIGDEVSIWGQVGMASGLTIEKGTVILGQTGVNKSLKKGTYFGPLAQEFKDYLRNEVKLKNLK